MTHCPRVVDLGGRRVDLRCDINHSPVVDSDVANHAVCTASIENNAALHQVIHGHGAFVLKEIESLLFMVQNEARLGYR